MAEQQDAVQRLRLGHGVREIWRNTGVHRSIIRSLAGIGSSRGWLDQDREPPSEEEIQAARRRERSSEKLLADRLEGLYEQIARWVSEGYNGVVIHQLVCERFPCSAAPERASAVCCAASPMTLTTPPTLGL